MANQNILLIGADPFILFIEAYFSQRFPEFQIIKVKGIDEGLEIVKKEIPQLIFLEFEGFDQDYLFKMMDLKDLSQQTHLIIFNLLIDHFAILRELLQAGVDDIIFNPMAFRDLDKIIAPLFTQPESKELTPLLHNLLTVIEYQGKILKEATVDLQWYKYSLGLVACDCKYLILHDKHQAPTSSALNRIFKGQSYRVHEKYRCEICNTVWTRQQIGDGEHIVWTPEI